MATTSRDLLLIIASALILFSCKEQSNSKMALKDYRPTILQQFDGTWRMKGHVQGDSVEYLLTGAPVLDQKFLRLHMVDTNRPAAYEALVFIGYDSTSKMIYTHWMDSFGAAYSVPHGTGTLKENQIEFYIPYTTSTFRDLFTFDAGRQQWEFTIESRADSTQEWKNFASYIITRDRR